MVSEKSHKSRAGDAIRSLDASSFKNVNVLVTGGGGYFGVHLGRALHMLGANVTLFDIQSPIEDFSPEIEFVKGNICDKKCVEDVCKGMGCVFHLVSYGMSGPEMLKSSKLIESINVGGTSNVIEACYENNVSRLVYTSSIAVVTGCEVLEDATEEMCQALPFAKYTDDYSRTKCIAEKKILAANGRTTKGGSLLHTCALRPPGIYGVGEKRHFPRIINLMESGQVMFTIGGLETLNDFIHIDNLVNSHILAGEALSQEKQHKSAGEVYFITDGDPKNNWTFFRPFIEGLGYTFPRINIPYKFMFLIVLVLEWLHLVMKPYYHFTPIITRTELYQLCVSHYFNIDKARKHLGFEPLKRDISDIVEYYVDQGYRRKESQTWRFLRNVFIGAACAVVAMSFLL